MKPFDLEKAIAGKKLVTREGHEVREFHHFKNVSSEYPICAVIQGYLAGFTDKGRYHSHGNESALDLFMAPETITLYHIEVVSPESTVFSYTFRSEIDRSKFIKLRASDYKRIATFEREVEL